VLQKWPILLPALLYFKKKDLHFLQVLNGPNFTNISAWHNPEPNCGLMEGERERRFAGQAISTQQNDLLTGVLGHYKKRAQ
jgi:hypothetical protein